jgi:outer membrane protein assembly factor BamB
MKKRTKIILIIVGIVAVTIAYFGYNLYQIVAGSEKLIGKLDGIPPSMTTFPPLSKGNADWPNWRGSNLDGKSATTGIKKDWSNGLQKLWQLDYLCQDKSTACWATPVVQGNRLIVPGRDAKNDLVFCINTEDGKLIWSSSYEAPAETSHGPGARATPFIDSTRVYTFGRSGDLVCWNLEDGKMLWRKNVKEQGGQEPQWGLSSSPFVYENKVIVQGGGKALVIAYDKMTGDVLWKSLEGEAGYSAATLIKIENETKLLIYHAKALSCLNPADGKELWRVPWETEYGVNATTPLVDSNLIFHTSGYGMGGQALKINKGGFSVLWKNNAIAAQHSDPILIDGYIYAYSGESSQNKGFLKCVELATGKETWSSDQAGCGTMTYVDGYLICLDIKGNLFLVKPNPQTFEKAGELLKAIEDVKNPEWTAPVVANGKLYLRYLQRLVCYNLIP